MWSTCRGVERLLSPHRFSFLSAIKPPSFRLRGLINQKVISGGQPAGPFLPNSLRPQRPCGLLGAPFSLVGKSLHLRTMSALLKAALRCRGLATTQLPKKGIKSGDIAVRLHQFFPSM